MEPSGELELHRGIVATTPQHELIARRWKLGRKIGSGGFGDVHLARCVYCESTAAVKIALGLDDKDLECEYVAYRTMESATRILIGIPEALAFGYQAGRTILVMSRLGPSLEALLDKCGRSMSIHTVYQIALQLLTRIEFVHNCGYLHRDIKPENLLMGSKANESTLFLIDFGLSKMYREGHTKQHIEWKEGIPFFRTARFCSINAHLGIEQSRRDDLESIGYVLVYLFHGRLPWQRSSGINDSQNREKVRRSKERMSPRKLCFGMGSAMIHYFDYLQSIPFESRPDYSYLRMLFVGGLERRGLKEDGVFDWMKVSRSSSASVAE